jgi:uracil-DNA glycosylase
MTNKDFSQYLDVLELDVWVPRAQTHSETCLEAPMTREQKIGNSNWQQLEDAVKNCTACPLHRTRTQAVFGVGNRQADLFVVGEAPGANEDKQGEPFVGRAGQLLTAMLRAIGLGRSDVYIANVLKSRPPSNRDPTPEEIKACTPYLLRQISLVQPKLILAVGRVAAQYLLQENRAMMELRNRLLTFSLPGTSHTIPLIVTYHPAYLLRSPKEKAKAWQDMIFLAKQLKRTK